MTENIHPSPNQVGSRRAVFPFQRNILARLVEEVGIVPCDTAAGSSLSDRYEGIVAWVRISALEPANGTLRNPDRISEFPLPKAENIGSDVSEDVHVDHIYSYKHLMSTFLYEFVLCAREC
ncbi:hypothetical protein [Rhizobium lusitanum]|uniref:hypothetical protein n=1 Tax=Rhizobium lusitanum TaxID=293958 RepID=UPI001FEE3445|nr:hypothetical protein [Rhizobium lusitanum]